MMENTPITVSVAIQSKLNHVWDAYTLPKHITNWNFASDDWCCPSATNDLRAGGKYCARMEAKDKSFGFDFEAIYDEVIPKQKLVYHLSDSRKVLVLFNATNEQTEVTITFEAENQNSVELQRNGWQAILNNFKKYTEGLGANKATRLQFKVDVDASAAKCYNTMLGLGNQKLYEEWTSVFNPTSTYQGNWEKGSKIYFVGTDAEGKVGGMLSRILENDAYHFVSIQHYGLIKDGVETTEGPEVDQWAGGLENYLFEEIGGATTITVEVDVIPNHADYFKDTYPNALQKLKEIVERQ